MPALFIFIITYIGIALGGIPGLALNRVGIAILGAIAMTATGIISLQEAVLSIDVPTILLLYSLMILSAQYQLGGFYTWAAVKVTAIAGKPNLFLFMIMFVSGAISSLLTNDIVCFAFTPILAMTLLRSRLNPVPFLLALAISSNIGSAATIIGNPQNIFIGQVSHVSFHSFLAWCSIPSLISLVTSYFLILMIYKNRLKLPETSTLGYRQFGMDTDCKLKPWPVMKAAICTVILIILFFTGIPREISAIAIAGMVLCSRTTRTENLLGKVDWNLITLFCTLFIVIHGISKTVYPELLIGYLKSSGVNFSIYQLPVISVLLSNLFSNVPAVVLIAKFFGPFDSVDWYIIALSSTYAGNLIVIGSIANMIVIEQAKTYNIRISFREHAATGIPVTIVSVLVLYLWIWIFN